MTRKDYAGNNTILLNTAVVSTDHCNTTLKQKYVKKKKYNYSGGWMSHVNHEYGIMSPTVLFL